METRNASAPEAQVRERLESWSHAVRARDIDKVLAHHSKDVVMFDVPPPVEWRGIQKYRESWEYFFKHFPREGGRFDLENVEIVTCGDLACAYGLLKCGRPGDTFPVRLTMILRNVGGAWTIVHEHHSVPATDT
jgi:ketosteroid isomerase-like protein